jgi:hypothetical protein
MIKELGSIVRLITQSVSKFNEVKKASESREYYLEMLKIYFLLMDLHADGAKMLELTKPNAIEYLNSASGEAQSVRVANLDKFLRRQGARLYEINNYFTGRSELSVLDPGARRRIRQIVGAKNDRVINLFSLGAGLFFRTVLPIEERSEDVGRLVNSTLALAESESLDFLQITVELHEMSAALEEYGELIKKIIPLEQIIALSNKARDQVICG